jgi:20S proteasome subunit alpha 1
LEKKMKKGLSELECVDMAVECLSNVLSVEFKSAELEIGMVSASGTSSAADLKFKVLHKNEIDQHLSRIAEKD